MNGRVPLSSWMWRCLCFTFMLSRIFPAYCGEFDHVGQCVFWGGAHLSGRCHLISKWRQKSSDGFFFLRAELIHSTVNQNNLHMNNGHAWDVVDLLSLSCLSSICRVSHGLSRRFSTVPMLRNWTHICRPSADICVNPDVSWPIWGNKSAKPHVTQAARLS